MYKYGGFSDVIVVSWLRVLNRSGQGRDERRIRSACVVDVQLRNHPMSVAARTWSTRFNRRQ